MLQRRLLVSVVAAVVFLIAPGWAQKPPDRPPAGGPTDPAGDPEVAALLKLLPPTLANARLQARARVLREWGESVASFFDEAAKEGAVAVLRGDFDGDGKGDVLIAGEYGESPTEFTGNFVALFARKGTGWALVHVLASSMHNDPIPTKFAYVAPHQGGFAIHYYDHTAQCDMDEHHDYVVRWNKGASRFDWPEHLAAVPRSLPDCGE